MTREQQRNIEFKHELERAVHEARAQERAKLLGSAAAAGGVTGGGTDGTGGREKASRNRLSSPTRGGEKGKTSSGSRFYARMVEQRLEASGRNIHVGTEGDRSGPGNDGGDGPSSELRQRDGGDGPSSELRQRRVGLKRSSSLTSMPTFGRSLSS